MPMPIYATFDGIQGSCQVKGREGTVEVVAFNHSLWVPVDPRSHTVSSSREYGPLVITANMDKATPMLIESAINNKEIKKATLDFYTVAADGRQIKYFTILLEPCRVVKVTTWFPNVDDAATKSYKHMVTYELLWGRIEWTHLDGNITVMDSWIEPQTE